LSRGKLNREVAVQPFLKEEVRSHGYGFALQFKTTLIGEDDSSLTVFIKNR
jgi:hypothetical protein